MTSSLDRVDKEIVCILQEDGRAPIAEMARAIGVSEPTIRRKLGRLLSEEVVSIRAISDPVKLGFGASAYIGLDVELGRIEEVAALLGGYPMIESVTVTTGPHDITIKATFDSIAALTAFVVGELARIDGIKDSQSAIILRTYKNSVRAGVAGHTPARRREPEASDEAAT